MKRYQIGMIWFFSGIAVVVLAGIAWYLLSIGRISEEKMAQITVEYNGVKREFCVGSYQLMVRLALNDETTVKYIVPVDSDGKALPSASNIVFYVPYNGDWGEAVEEIDWIKPFWHEFGYSVFSMSIKADTLIALDRKKYYIYPDAGWYEVFAGIKQRLIEKFSLHSRPLIVVGQSAGGSLIQQMMAAKPDWVDIGAWGGGCRYREWSGRNRGAILALSTWGCYGTGVTDIMARNLTDLGGVLLRGNTPVWEGDYHSIGIEGQRLIQLFVRDMVALREKNHHVMPAPETCYERLSAEFNMLWQTLPHDFLQKALHDEPGLNVFPGQTSPNRIIWVVSESDNVTENTGALLDGFRILSENGALVIWNKISNNLLDSLPKMERQLAEILAEEKWRDLPLHVVGNGSGGQLAGVAALKNNHLRIKHISTFNSAMDSPFEELSMAAFLPRSEIPVTMFFTGALRESPSQRVVVKMLQSGKSRNAAALTLFLQTQLAGQ